MKTAKSRYLIVRSIAAFLAAAICALGQTTWPHKVYKLVNVNSGKALDVTSYSLDLGETVQQWDYNGTSNQMWTIQYTGYYSYVALENINSAYVLDVRDWTSSNNFNGQVIQQWWKDGYYTAGNQMILMSHLGSGRYNLIVGASAKYLTVDSASTSNGATVVQYDTSGGNHQKWDVYEVSHTWSTPSYSPSFWNNDYDTKINNNCYNYANNKRTDSFAQPGKSSGQAFASHTTAELQNRCNQDQLNVTTSTASAPNGQTKIVMYTGYFYFEETGTYGYDFHLWRKDSNGMWSHKPGKTNATNLHAGGGTISDPAALTTSQRGGYDTLVGYFFTPSDSRDGRGHGNVW
jgi:hypothetical protein